MSRNRHKSDLYARAPLRKPSRPSGNEQIHIFRPYMSVPQIAEESVHILAGLK